MILPASASQILELQACATMPGQAVGREFQQGLTFQLSGKQVVAMTSEIPIIWLAGSLENLAYNSQMLKPAAYKYPPLLSRNMI